MRPDLLKQERAMVLRALQFYAGHLTTEGKRLMGLGQSEMANELAREASHITDFLTKEFADGPQTEAALEPAAPTRVAKAGEVKIGPHLVVDAPVCEACDNPDPSVQVRDDWANAKMCDTCVATLKREQVERRGTQAPPDGDPGPWEDWKPGDVPPHAGDAQEASDAVDSGESKP